MTEEQFKNESIWRGHVEEARKHPKSISAYCRDRGISRSGFNYWQKRLGAQSLQRKRTPAEVAVKRRPSAFIPVELLPFVPVSKSGPQLPDPKWVAELILHLTSDMIRSCR